MAAEQELLPGGTGRLITASESLGPYEKPKPGRQKAPFRWFKRTKIGLEMLPVGKQPLLDMASRGLSIDQMCLVMGVSEDAFRKMRGRQKWIDIHIKAGRAVGMATVTNALYENAIKGNVAAQIFYLKNRDPESWKERRETAITGKDGGPIELTSDLDRAARILALIGSGEEEATGSNPH